MWNNLFDYWKGLTCLGAVTLPFAGWFFLSTKTINWNTPLGYYTQLKLFIRREGGALQASSAVGSVRENANYQLIQASEKVSEVNSSSHGDLLVEYLLTSLDKESYWRYCLPKNSKLQKSNVQATSTSQSVTEACTMKWKSSSDTEIISYLLKLGMDFFKLQHQMNLFSIYHLKDKITDDNNEEIKKQILSKCELHQEDNKSYLKDFFISNAPISKKCLLTPREVELTLEINEAVAQVQSGSISQTDLKLDELKKGKLSGSIKYSLSSYHGELHKFDWKNHQRTAGDGNFKDSVLIELKGKSFELGLESSGAEGSSGGSNLKFNDLLEKYRKRELEICDFWKDYETERGVVGGAITTVAHRGSKDI